MNIYELLEAESDKQTDTLYESLFSKTNRQKLDNEEDIRIFDLLRNS